MNRSDSARVREMTRRVLSCWDAASPDDLASGLTWYDRAEAFAADLATDTITRDAAAGVIAALSPRCGWSVNLAGASRLCEAFATNQPIPVVAGTLSNREKAWRVLGSNSDPLEILSGPKVRAFYRNIVGDTDAVTVDVWTARAAEGPTCGPRAPDGKRYRLIADAYRHAGTSVGHSPRDIQATVWTYSRRTLARTIFDPKGLPG